LIVLFFCLYLRPILKRCGCTAPDSLIINDLIYNREMFWTLELAGSLDDAPWPANKDELIDFANRSGAPSEVIENLEELEDDGEIYESIEDIWPDYPTKDDFFFNEEEY